MRLHRNLLTGIMAISCLLAYGGCSKKGPGERAGEKLDSAGKGLKDAVTPDGPAEKAGKKVDEAADNVQDATHDTKRKLENHR